MKRPNILWIYCDELRTDALGCYGNPYAEMQTPHIDSIAASGIRFDNCFCNSPVCVASRASILTGLYPEDLGVYHNEAVWPNYRFQADVQTFPSVFARHGYQVANFGKVHVPAALQPWTTSDERGAGMREFYQDVDVGALQMIRAPGIPPVLGGVYPADRPYPADRVTDNALTWLNAVEDPFLLRVSYLQPHTPVLPPPPFDSLYPAASFPDSVEPVETSSQFERRFAEIIRGHELSAQEIRLVHAHYYGLVAWIDTQVGRLLDFLQQRNLRQETMIIFEADHGCSLGEGGRFQKQTFAPESQRVPRLISWPGTVAPGQVHTEACASLDLARTLFALAGIAAPDQFKGRDLLDAEPDPIVYSTIGYGFAGSRAFPNLAVGAYVDGHGWPRRSCVRTNRFRLDKNVRLDGRRVTAQEEDIFLADYRADPRERVNLAADPAYQETVTQLSALLDQHRRDAVEVPEAWTVRAPQPAQRRSDSSS